MKPFYEKGNIRIYYGDCRDVLPLIGLHTACVTDPPYGLGFMGKGWDHGVPGVEFWKTIKAALLPGAHCLAFGGTRTHHRLMVAMEDAGFELRDCLMWLYGQGWPKSLDIGKAIDKAAGAEREVVGVNPTYRKDQINAPSWSLQRNPFITAPATDAAKLWDGWGTSLKPAYEPIILAMKPLDGTYAQDALKHGVAGLWIDGCRIPCEAIKTVQGKSTAQQKGLMYSGKDQRNKRPFENTKGRWPPNLLHDGGEEVMALFPETKSGVMRAGTQRAPHAANSVFRGSLGNATDHNTPGDSGLASRFFPHLTDEIRRGYYTGKASKANRGTVTRSAAPLFDEGETTYKNDHPTVKPTDLMEWLITLLGTPTGGAVLDPFMGSGSTLIACQRLGRTAIGIDDDEHYCEIAAERLENEPNS